MDLRHTGSDEQLVCVKTERLTVMIKGSQFHPALAGVETTDKEAGLSIECDDDFVIEMAGDAETVGFETHGNMFSAGFRSRPLFYEQQNYEIIIELPEGSGVEEAESQQAGTVPDGAATLGGAAGAHRTAVKHTVQFWHENYNVRKAVTPVGAKKKLLTGIINFRNEIGFSDLVIRLDGADYLTIKIEVFPTKINYKDDYKAIVADVTSEVYSLVFDFLKRTYTSLELSSTQQSSQVEFFAIIRKIYGDFIKAADMILRNPHHQLQTEHEVLPWYKVRRTDNRTIRWLEKHPEYAVRVDGSGAGRGVGAGFDGAGFGSVGAGGSGTVIKAERALAVRKYVTFDTKENRLTKFMLEQTARRLEHFKAQYCQLKRESDQEVIEQIDSMTRGILRRCTTGFMNDVSALAADSGMSLVFGMAPGYRELYRCYLMLKHGLTVTGSIFNISLKDLAVLYEYWCFIKLNRLMKERYKLISQDIIHVNSAGLYVALEKGVKSEVKYENTRTGEIITLAYNRSETDLPTVAQKPDNILSLKKKGASTTYEYVFDAKYRIDPAAPGSYYRDVVKAETPGPMVDDINTMHRYRDAIVYQNGSSPFERTMFGAYILFPYHDEEEYKDHKFYKSIEQVNIGGLPFLPSATGLVTKMLEELISDSPDSAFERATLPRGIEEKLAKVDWKRRDVLVGTLRSKEQLSWCLGQRAYVIPAANIKEENLPIRYVALYETVSAFGSEAKIEYYGEVKTIRLVHGSGESDNPFVTADAGDEMYYQLKVKTWKELDSPIRPKEIGFIRMFTNRFLLEHSTQVNELFLHSEEEYRFYSELKRRADETVIEGDNKSGFAGFKLGKRRIEFADGEIRMLADETVVGKCSIVEFSNRPNAMFRRLMGYWEKVKG